MDFRPLLRNTLLRLLAVVMTLLIAAWLFPVPGQAQATTGALVGSVTDSTGAVVVNATVIATNRATGVKTTAMSNERGEYRIANLLVGAYTITASRSGFASTTINDFPVELNKTATASLTLKAAGDSTFVEVSGTAPAIDTTTAQLQTTYDAKATADLPTANIGNGVLNLSLLEAGVSSTGGIGAGAGPSVGGQRARNNNFTVEGVDINDKSVTGPIIQLPGDSVQNFTVILNQFSPEFGHSSGGQFNQVIQSGTNSFHGKAYEYLQNRNLNAIDQSVANKGLTKNPRFDDNRFGGSIGGPIWKNKAFFFFNGEYEPQGLSAVPAGEVSAPTAAGYATLAGIPGLSANNLSVFKQFVPAAPTASGTVQVGPADCAGKIPSAACVPVEVGILPIAAPNFTNRKKYLGSGDWNISDHDVLHGRYVYNSNVGIDTSATLPVFYTNSPTIAHLATLSEFHTFTPSLTNEFRGGYSRQAQTFPSGNFAFPGLDSFPNLQFQDLGGLQVGPDPNAPQFGIQNLYQLTDNVSWNKGNHNFKFGFEWHHYISPQSFTQRSRGDYQYTSVNDFLRDVAPDVLAERSGGNTTYYGDQNAFYWFVNDTWKIRPTVSLNLGLRHEHTTRPVGERRQNLNKISDAPDILVGGTPLTFDAPQAPKANFAPRVGIAWAPDTKNHFLQRFLGEGGQTSIRAGFGMAYDVLFDNIGILEQPPQIGSTLDCTITDIANNTAGCPSATGYLAAGGIKGGGSGITVIPNQADARAATASWIPPRVKYPYSMSWNMGVERVIHRDYTFEVRYVGTRGVHLDTQSRINRQAKVTPDLFLPTFFSTPTQAQVDSLGTTLDQIKAQSSFVPAYAAAGFTSSIVAFIPNGGSTYHGLSTQLTRRFGNGLYMQAAYTWSHNIDDSTADFFSTVLTPRRPQDFQNMRADRGNSALDRNQRFTLAIVYDVPLFKHSNWFLKNLVGNWEVAPVYIFETGEWADVQSALDANLNGDSAGDRFVANPTGSRNLSSGVTPLTNSITGATVAYLASNPNAYYVSAGSGALANGSKNTLQMPGINNVDLTLVKRYSFTERYKFEFAANMLNAMNHPQFIPGSLNDIRSVGQTAGPVLNLLTAGNKGFNNPSKVFNSNARVVQLSAKFIF